MHPRVTARTLGTRRSVRKERVITTVGWVLVGMAIWVIAGLGVGIVVGRVVRQRDRQRPADPPPPPEPGSVPVQSRRPHPTEQRPRTPHPSDP